MMPLYLNIKPFCCWTGLSILGPVLCQRPCSFTHRLQSWFLLSFAQNIDILGETLVGFCGRTLCVIWLTSNYVLLTFPRSLCAKLSCSVVSLCNTMDCSPPGSSVHGHSPGKNTGVGCHTLSRVSNQPRDQTQVSCIAGRCFTFWASREAQEYSSG